MPKTPRARTKNFKLSYTDKNIVYCYCSLTFETPGSTSPKPMNPQAFHMEAGIVASIIPWGFLLKKQCNAAKGLFKLLRPQIQALNPWT